MSSDVFLVLHGWGGNKPEHWQEHLVNNLTADSAKVYYPQMPSPQEPCLDAWLERLDAEMQTIGKEWGADYDINVLAHSLGSITWMHYAAQKASEGHQLADRVLLVAPPYILPQAPPLDAPPTVAAFFPPPLDAAAIKTVAAETTLIASDTDDYATFDQSRGYAAKLGIPIHLLKGAGHISPYYGYGDWPWVLDWCLRLADFPPLPRP